MYYLSAKFQVNNTSQSEDTVGGPFGPPPRPPQHLRALKSPVLLGLKKNIYCEILRKMCVLLFNYYFAIT